jgi:hypothetical protein
MPGTDPLATACAHMESIRAKRSFEIPACSGAASVNGADFFRDRVCACPKKEGSSANSKSSDFICGELLFLKSRILYPPNITNLPSL